MVGVLVGAIVKIDKYFGLVYKLCLALGVKKIESLFCYLC